MNQETFASASQNDLIDWAVGLANDVVSGDLDISDEAGVTNDDLIYALAVYKLLAEQDLVISDKSYKIFAPQAEAELRRRLGGTV